MSAKTKKILAVSLLLLLVLAALFAYLHFSPSAAAGEKEISFQVTHGDGNVKSFSISTDADNLRSALEQEGLISGDESQYGLYVTQVDGETADDSLRQWWCFMADGVMLNTGVDDTMIADGESYEAAISTY